MSHLIYFNAEILEAVCILVFWKHLCAIFRTLPPFPPLAFSPSPSSAQLALFRAVPNGLWTEDTLIWTSHCPLSFAPFLPPFLLCLTPHSRWRDIRNLSLSWDAERENAFEVLLRPSNENCCFPQHRSYCDAIPKLYESMRKSWSNLRCRSPRVSSFTRGTYLQWICWFRYVASST